MRRSLIVFLLMCSSALGQGVPTLTDINPKTAVQGAIVAVTLSGSNFINGTTSVISSSPGVIPLSVRVTSGTSAVATLDLAAIPGKYTLRVKTPGGTSTGNFTFTVTGNTISPADQFDVASFAGPEGGAGSIDGTGASARFSKPAGIWVNGNLAYVADSNNNTIRQTDITSGKVTTIAGTPGVIGSNDGVGAAAQFASPVGIWGDGANLYITDAYNLEIRKLQLATGAVTTIAGSYKVAPAIHDGVGAAAQFVGPTGIWGDGTNLYVADSLSTTTRAIRKIVISTGQVTTLADLGAPVGVDTTSALSISTPLYPVGVWGDATALYLADSGRHTVRKLDLATNGIVTFIGTDGQLNAFRYPSGISGDDKNIYVANTGDQTVFRVPKVGATASGASVKLAGSSLTPGYTDGAAIISRLYNPTGIVLSGTSILITETGNNDVRLLDTSQGTVTTIAGAVAPGGSIDGIGSGARFDSPWGICGDAANTYVADQYNLGIRRTNFAPSASVLTLTGTPNAGGNIDGSFSQAKFALLSGIWCDGMNVFVTDSYFDTIRQVALFGNNVVTLAGNPRVASGYLDGVGLGAVFDSPNGIWGDGINLYVADTSNSVIRKINISTGQVTTLAGTPQISGSVDGIGPAAKFLLPTSLWGDGTYLYVTDGNTIRQINLSTTAVSTFAGAPNRPGNSDGVALQARFFLPFGIWGDGTSLFVADSGNSLIRKIDLQTGIVSTIAGFIVGSENGRGPAGRFNIPIGIWGDGSALYVVDSGNNRLRKLTPVLPPDPTTVTNSGDITYQIADRGGLTSVTANGSTTQVGYARILPTGGSTTPSGLAIFGFRQNGTLVSEAAVPAIPLIQSGRLYTEIGGGVDTGLAMANPNNQTATITFFFTDANGTDQFAGSTTIPPNGQIAAFLDQAPFLGGTSQTQLASLRTFTFLSNFPIGVVALRGFTNERSEFLITTLPVISLDQPVTSTDPLTFPHFADASGWKTHVILVNPTDAPISGSLQFFSQGSATKPGSAITLTASGSTSDTFKYTIPARSSYKLDTAGIGANIQVGSVRVTPATNAVAPAGLLVFSYNNGGITVSEAGVPALPASAAFRLYAEASGDFNANAVGSIQTGVAISNPSATNVTVNFELTRLDGSSTGLTGSTTVPGSGQIAVFLNQINGFSNLPAPFQGILRITGATVNVTGLRGRYNERGDFLITTTSPISETAPPTTSELIFPHLVDGGGYTTQFVLFSSTPGHTTGGVLRFFNQAGGAIKLGLQ